MAVRRLLSDSRNHEPSPTPTPSGPVDRGRCRRARPRRRRRLGVGDAGARDAPPAADGHDTAHADAYGGTDADADPHAYAHAYAHGDPPAPAVGDVAQPAPADAGHDDSRPAAPTEAGGDTEAALGPQAIGDDGTEVHTGVTAVIAAAPLSTAITSLTAIVLSTAVPLVVLVASVTADSAVDTVVHESAGDGCCSAHGRRPCGRRPRLLTVGRRPARSGVAPSGPHSGGHRAGRHLLVPDLVAPGTGAGGDRAGHRDSGYQERLIATDGPTAVSARRLSLTAAQLLAYLPAAEWATINQIIIIRICFGVTPLPCMEFEAHSSVRAGAA